MDPFLGEIRMFCGNFAPRGWALCNGQLLPIAQNSALFSILGTTFGGNGQTTFGLPDLRGRTPVHPGQGPGLSPYDLGQSAGSESITLLQTQIPAHTHVVNASNVAATATTASGNVPATVTPPRGQSTIPTTYGPTADTAMNPNMIGPAGNSQPHGNIQPYLCVNFIIATQGIFPTRN